mmetsp:Transcript_37282/g.79173  ORF Transcript_37282/g.79173 Transcript_37282/m.79173 type:complete len:206 (+) Transcript_37282:142-759(+)
MPPPAVGTWPRPGALSGRRPAGRLWAAFLLAQVAVPEVAAALPGRNAASTIGATTNGLFVLAPPEAPTGKGRTVIDEIRSMGRELCEKRPDHPSCKIFEEEEAAEAAAPAATEPPPTEEASPSSTTAPPPSEPTRALGLKHWGAVEAVPASAPAPRPAGDPAAALPWGPLRRWGHTHTAPAPAPAAVAVEPAAPIPYVGPPVSRA